MDDIREGLLLSAPPGLTGFGPALKLYTEREGERQLDIDIDVDMHTQHVHIHIYIHTRTPVIF
jgi:hypothetical protein